MTELAVSEEEEFIHCRKEEVARESGPRMRGEMEKEGEKE